MDAAPNKTKEIWTGLTLIVDLLPGLTAELEAQAQSSEWEDFQWGDHWINPWRIALSYAQFNSLSTAAKAHHISYNTAKGVINALNENKLLAPFHAWLRKNPEYLQSLVAEIGLVEWPYLRRVYDGYTLDIDLLKTLVSHESAATFLAEEFANLNEGLATEQVYAILADRKVDLTFKILTFMGKTLKAEQTPEGLVTLERSLTKALTVLEKVIDAQKTGGS